MHKQRSIQKSEAFRAKQTQPKSFRRLVSGKNGSEVIFPTIGCLHISDFDVLEGKSVTFHISSTFISQGEGILFCFFFLFSSDRVTLCRPSCNLYLLPP
uniref:Macaca fascicularis brain cDNA clone: QflA-18426, similar to human KIAA0391 (KIAA0391), mRNA, RefSeq: XM_375074.1 n=1 Tax=Macaca fascicularis TaxID=9541 RepID=I7GMV1_MACFA|nr:unnamed protein product [Macaca fascicularis]